MPDFVAVVASVVTLCGDSLILLQNYISRTIAKCSNKQALPTCIATLTTIATRGLNK